MENSLVTVIIPAYNCDKYIESAIDSVLQQTYLNYELIVVDDGSTDKTAEKILNYKNKLRYVCQDNGGVSKARNTGIEHSNGKFIAFLDADDVWEKNKLEIQVLCFQKYPDVNLIFSNFKHIKNNETFNNIRFEDTFNIFKEYKLTIKNIFNNASSFELNKIAYQFYWGNIYQYLFLGNFILPSSVLLRKASLNQVGTWNEKYRVAEETEFFLRFSRNNLIGFIDYPLLGYELPEPDNLSGKKNTEKLIKNALKIQMDSIIQNQDLYHRKARYYDRGIGMTYCRLAYYYLSEYRMIESRKYALFSIKTYYYYFKPYIIYILSYLPIKTLGFIAKYKILFKK